MGAILLTKIADIHGWGGERGGGRKEKGLEEFNCYKRKITS